MNIKSGDCFPIKIHYTFFLQIIVREVSQFKTFYFHFFYNIHSCAYHFEVEIFKFWWNKKGLLVILKKCCIYYLQFIFYSSDSFATSFSSASSFSSGWISVVSFNNSMDLTTLLWYYTHSHLLYLMPPWSMIGL